MKKTVFHFILISCCCLFLLTLLFDYSDSPNFQEIIQLIGNSISGVENPMDGVIDAFEVISVFFTEGETISIQNLLDLFLFPFKFIGSIIQVLYNILKGLSEIFT